jgi:DNA-binding transcriptional LysR family regulator
LDFRQIEAFIQVVKLKSFSKAADAVFLTQPTISTHINSLENELGVKLVDRSGKEIVPTKAGKIFYDYANSLLNVRDSAIHSLNEFSTKIEGKLEIAASTVPSQYLLPELMAAFLEHYKKVNLCIIYKFYTGILYS